MLRTPSEPKVHALRVSDVPAWRGSGLPSHTDRAVKPGRLARRLEVDRLHRGPYSGRRWLRTGSKRHTSVGVGGRVFEHMGYAPRVLSYDT